MRSYLYVLSFAALLLGSSLQASPAENADEFSRQFGWYQWVCYAWAPGYYQPFTGSSYHFQGWFGESREARRVAHQNALDYCEFYTDRECQSRIESDCRLRRD